jgi:hypothetical protein
MYNYAILCVMYIIFLYMVAYVINICSCRMFLTTVNPTTFWIYMFVFWI